jgi:YD repeat-containing protein
MSFFHDPLGHVTFLTRHHVQNDEDLSMRWRYDSLGRAIEFTDVGSSLQRRQYDSWGGLVSSQWCDPTISPCSGQATNRGTYLSHDALGRVVSSEDRSNGSVIPETVRQFAYDQPVALDLPDVVARNVSGRLAQATSATSSVAYGYDAFGRIETEAYRDLTTGAEDLFVQTREFNGDGTLKSIGFLLPDNQHAEEKADYTYDSGRRMRSVDFSDRSTSRNLYSA